MTCENKIDGKLRNLRKKNILLDNLSCSIYYKNLVLKKNKLVEKIDPIYFFKSIYTLARLNQANSE